MPFHSARLLTLTALACALVTSAQSPTLTIDAGKIAHPVSPSLYGLMTEEINHSYDGGLYAEMVANRTFRTAWDGVQQWGLVRNGNAKAAMGLDKTNGPSKALPTSLKLRALAASTGNEAGISNSGWWGMAVRPNTAYKGSLYAQPGAQDPGPVTIQFINDDTGATLAQATITPAPRAWARYEYTLQTGKVPGVSAHNHLQLTVARPGTLSLQLVSLFPPTYHNRANGNRPDLMERMAAMHPAFLRLPGGNYLEGDRPEDWYNWPTTLGPLVDRPGHQAPWTYWSTDGLGLLEFLEWCEDLHVEPVLAVYAGYALKGKFVEGAELQPFIQSALDEVEYVTGDTSTRWGAQRAKDGHPAPFPLHYIEVGNEDWLDHSGSYERRYPPFALALRKKYPQYKIIATAPLKAATLASNPGAEPDMIDDHYYKSPADMFDLVHHYDNAPRNGPKIFVGEWATRSGSPTPNFGDALGDAAWMTSMERNSDLILMAAYAPLLVNVNPGGMQWSTDLIGFDALTTYGSPSYWAQVLFAAHLGDGMAESTASGLGERVFYSATVSSRDKVLHLKLVNATETDQPMTLNLNGLGSGNKTANVESLHGATFQATNSITNPDMIRPVSSTAKFHAGQQSYTAPAYTIQVVDIPM